MEREFNTRYQKVDLRVVYEDDTVDEEVSIFFIDGTDEITHLLNDEVLAELLIEAQMDYNMKYEEPDFFDRADYEYELQRDLDNI